ncbi:MAG: carbonic anhydrase [Saprospiraceae bacterium]|nr:carbonic anhydrase [Saprospiraceae bacterium]
MKTLTKEMQAKLSPAQCIKLLKDGNERFVNNLKLNRNLLQQVNETSTGQFPFAVILSCIDSRTSAELIFDQGLGDIFSARIAGNIVNEDILGSMEFSCKLAGSKVIVVLGHTSCGAVKGACDHVKMGNLTVLLDKLAPAVNAEKTVEADRTSKNLDFVDKVAKINVDLAKKQILQRSDILRDMNQNGEIAIVGAMYNVDSGTVEFMND